MTVSVTIRNVPEPVRDELAARASRAGLSLQAYLRAALIDIASRPTVESFLEQVRVRVAASGVVLKTDDLFAVRDADRR
jgi:plasmid stability protein